MLVVSRVCGWAAGALQAHFTMWRVKWMRFCQVKLVGKEQYLNDHVKLLGARSQQKRV